MGRRKIGFVSTRFAGTDGVSLESTKWADVLADHGYSSYWYAGILDRDPDTSMLVPEASFAHPDIAAINAEVFGRLSRTRQMTRKLFEISEHLKGTLYDFIEKFSIDILVVENALCMPMNLPLGIALTHLIVETGIPTIGHHHDFFWERDRFSVNAVPDILEKSFPPVLPSLQHATINTAAEQDLAMRKGVSSHLVPNVLDFENGPPPIDAYDQDLREQIGIAPDDILALQPTRVIPRKGIEKSIELIAELGEPRCKLVITHEAGDEGREYERMLRHVAKRAQVDLRFVNTRVSDERETSPDGQKLYSLWDVYRHADLVTFPSLYEGFGNALLEAFFCRKPVVVNRYAVFISDIEPKGFKVISMSGYVTPESLNQVRRVFDDEAFRNEMVDHNYELGRVYYSYRVLRRKLRTLVFQLTGEDIV
ncbi:MAG: glycosyltransferase family 4 protein [Pirellulales bacterium]|nr:glycosyltransferase family 4 protein [Pirellulales bacterium]